MEEQRRRTQEIKLTREELERLPLSMNGAASSGPASVTGNSERFRDSSREGSPRYQKPILRRV